MNLKKLIRETVEEISKFPNAIFPDIIKGETPNVIFLAGPIQEAPEWHKEAIKIINDLYLKQHKPKETQGNLFGNIDHLNQYFTIACPKRMGEMTNFNYNRQVDWESFYLNQASKKGVILFWLPKAAEQNQERSYAQTTRFELAEWVTKYKYNKKISIVVGIEEEFHGEKYIIKRIKEETNIPIFRTLDQTCKKAFELNIKKFEK